MPRQISLPDDVAFLVQPMPDTGNPRIIGAWLARREMSLDLATVQLADELQPGEADVLIDLLAKITGRVVLNRDEYDAMEQEISDKYV